MKIADVNEAIDAKNWELAASRVDELLVEDSLDDETLALACYAQCQILLNSRGSNDSATRHPGSPTAQSSPNPQGEPRATAGSRPEKVVRNAVAYLMRTLEISVEKMMEKIAEKAVMTFLDLTKNLFEDDSTAMVFLIPLSNVVSALQKLNHEDRVLRITLHLLLSRVLTCYIEKYSKKQEKGDPWPSAEALAKYCKDAPEQALKHLESAMKLIKDRPALRYLLFQVTKVYLKNLSVQPSNKSTKFENLLKEESSLRVFIQLSIMENGQINQSDAKGLLSEVEKLCETCGSAEETLSILVDFAEQCIRQGLTDIAKRFLDKSMLMNGSTQLCHRRQLVQLQLELERIRASASLVAESDAQHAFMSAAAALMKALDLDCDSAIIHATCLQMFSAFISWKEANKFHPQWFTATVKSIADALTQRPGLEESKRCVIEYELAKCYEEQNVFSLAAAHAKKALVFCSQAELQGPIEIMIQKLSTKAKAFEGKLAPELQALSLVDQAKSVSQSGVALKLLENAIRTIIPDHEFISPAAAAESSDPVQALLGIEYHLTFDNIVLGSSKVKQLILVALNDIMIHSRQLALRVETKGNSNLRRLWKAAWDCSSYILCEAWVGVTVEKALLRIQAEANTIRGEALTFFLRVSDCTAEAETERGAEELQRKEAAILSSISQSISICQQISDVSMLESNASLLTGHYFETPDALKQSAAGACVDVFQKLYEAMASTGLKSSDLFLQVCLGYVQALKDLHDVAAPSTTPGDDRSKAKGSVAKAAPAKAAPGKDRENLKLAEEVFTVAFASPSNRYDLKLALFELRSTFRGAAGSPASESDPLLKLFATLEAMDSQKKPTREDLDSAVAELSRSAGKLPNELAITLWLKLIRFCNLAEQYLLAFSCIRALFGRIPSDLPAKAAAKKCNTDAGVLMECELLYGRIIFSLMTQKTPYGEYQVMRSDALLHFCNAIEYGSLSSSSMAQIETCLLLFRDVSAGSKLSQLGENYALFLERIIRSLQGCNFMSTARSEEFVNALIFLSDRCLEYFYFKRNFQAGTRLLDRLFRILPPAYHRMLWEKKIQILSDSGMQITSTVLGEASIEVQSNLWYKLALKSNGNQHRRSHLENVLQLVRLPGFELKFIEFGLEFVKWLLTETDELDKAKNLLSEVKVTLNTARSHSVNDQISQLKVLCIELDISETRLAKLSFVEKASAFLTQIIEGIFLTAQPSDSSTRSGHSSAKKSKDKEQPVEAEPCTMPARDKWVDFEWPQSVKASFQSTTDPRYLSAARSSEIRSVVSCTLRIILAHFELGRFPESMALISLLEFLSEICSADGVPMESLRHLCATLFSHAAIKIGSWTRAVAKLFSGSPPQNLSVKDTERVLCDIGVPVNTLSFSLQKSKILYDRSDYSQALDALALSFDSAEDSDLLSKIESAFLLDLLTETLEKTKSAVQIAKLGGVLCRNILPRYAGKLRKSFEHTHRSELKSIYLSALEGTHLSIPSKAVLHEELFYLAKAENTNESALGHFKLAVEYYKESESFASVVPITIDLAKFYLQEIPHYAPITERKHQEAALAAARVLQECNQNIQGLISNGTSFDPDLVHSLQLCFGNVLIHIAQSPQVEKPEDVHLAVKMIMEDIFPGECEKSVRMQWNDLQSEALKMAVSLVRPIYSSLGGKHLPVACRILAIASRLTERLGLTDLMAQLNPPTKSKSQEAFSQRGLRHALKHQNIDAIEYCCEDLLLHTAVGGHTDSVVFGLLSLWQSCRNARLLASLVNRYNLGRGNHRCPGTDSQIHNDYMNESGLHHRSVLQPLNPDLLQNLPKGVRLLVLQHSSDKQTLFCGLLSRSKETAKHKSSIDDFTFATTRYAVSFRDLRAMQDSMCTASEPTQSGLDALRTYLLPALSLLEPESPTAAAPAKAVEKAEPKKKGAKAELAEETDKGHCVVCCDEWLECLPVNAVIRGLSLASCVSLDLGPTYFLNRRVPRKDSDGSNAPPSTPSTTNAKCVVDAPALAGRLSTPAPPAKTEVLVVADPLITNSCLTAKHFESTSLVVALQSHSPDRVQSRPDGKAGWDPLWTLSLQVPPSVVAIITYLSSDGESNRADRLLACEWAAAAYLAGVKMSVISHYAASAHEAVEYARAITEQSGDLQLESAGATSQIIKNGVFSAAFLTYWGLLP